MSKLSFNTFYANYNGYLSEATSSPAYTTSSRQTPLDEAQFRDHLAQHCKTFTLQSPILIRGVKSKNVNPYAVIDPTMHERMPSETYPYVQWIIEEVLPDTIAKRSRSVIGTPSVDNANTYSAYNADQKAFSSYIIIPYDNAKVSYTLKAIDFWEITQPILDGAAVSSLNDVLHEVLYNTATSRSDNTIDSYATLHERLSRITAKELQYLPASSTTVSKRYTIFLTNALSVMNTDPSINNLSEYIHHKLGQIASMIGTMSAKNFNSLAMELPPTEFWIEGKCLLVGCPIPNTITTDNSMNEYVREKLAVFLAPASAPLVESESFSKFYSLMFENHLTSEEIFNRLNAFKWQPFDAHAEIGFKERYATDADHNTYSTANTQPKRKWSTKLYRGHKTLDPFRKTDDSRVSGDRVYWAKNPEYTINVYAFEQGGGSWGTTGQKHKSVLTRMTDDLKAGGMKNVPKIGFFSTAIPRYPNALKWYNNFGLEREQEDAQYARKEWEVKNPGKLYTGGGESKHGLSRKDFIQQQWQSHTKLKRFDRSDRSNAMRDVTQRAAQSETALRQDEVTDVKTYIVISYMQGDYRILDISTLKAQDSELYSLLTFDR